jgi:hypothetical protein
LYIVQSSDGEAVEVHIPEATICDPEPSWFEVFDRHNQGELGQ